MSNTFFQGWQKFLQGGFAPPASLPPGYGPGNYRLLKYTRSPSLKTFDIINTQKHKRLYLSGRGQINNICIIWWNTFLSPTYPIVHSRSQKFFVLLSKQNYELFLVQDCDNIKFYSQKEVSFCFSSVMLERNLLFFAIRRK